MSFIEKDTSSDETGSIWGEEDELPSQEWAKMDENYTNVSFTILLKFSKLNVFL